VHGALNARTSLHRGFPRTIGNEISLGVTSGLSASSTAFAYSGTVSVGWANMWSLVGTLAAIIHALDPFHPVGTCTPNISPDVLYNGFMRYANTLDLFGANVYGSAATGFVSKVAGIQGSTAWNRPFFASEFGMTNWFNAPYTGPTTAASASAYSTYLEDTSTGKAATYASAFQTFINGSAAASTALGVITSPYAASTVQGQRGGMFLGCYAFQFGWIWQATATWVNMLNFYPYTMLASTATGGVMAGYNGAGASVKDAWARGNEQAETLDTLIYMYTGAWPAITAPTIDTTLGLSVNGQYGAQNIFLQSGAQYEAFIDASDTNSPALDLGYQWMIIPIPSNGPTDHTTYAPIDAAGASWTATSSNWPILSQDGAGSCVFTAPTAAGQYRLSVWVYNILDGNAYKFTTHNAPFSVSAAASQFYYGVAGDTYVQGINASGSTTLIQASGALNFGAATQLLSNSFTRTQVDKCACGACLRAQLGLCVPSRVQMPVRFSDVPCAPAPAPALPRPTATTRTCRSTSRSSPGRPLPPTRRRKCR
jgi:hypothetical protein